MPLMRALFSSPLLFAVLLPHPVAAAEVECGKFSTYTVSERADPITIFDVCEIQSATWGCSASEVGVTDDARDLLTEDGSLWTLYIDPFPSYNWLLSNLGQLAGVLAPQSHSASRYGYRARC